VADEIEPDDDVLDAAASCPMEAIVIVDTETGETVEP
jgi:ferredoxin